MNNNKFVFWLIFLIIFVNACKSQEFPLQTPAEKFVTPTAMLPIRPFISPTLVQIPTFSRKDAYLELLELLKDNGGCKLPCIWGITPGQSNKENFDRLTVSLNSVFSKYNDFNIGLGNIAPDYELGDYLIHGQISYLIYPTSNVISRISLNLEARKSVKFDSQGEVTLGFQDVFDSNEYGKITNYYMIENILKVYGEPESIHLTTMAKRSSRDDTGGDFHVLLLYPKFGFMVLYTTQMQVLGSNVRGCLVNSHAQFDLIPQEENDLFMTIYEEKIRLEGYPIKSLDEVTSLSINDFYKLFSTSAIECIETPANLWPIPD
jgi:hypothetical protein